MTEEEKILKLIESGQLTKETGDKLLLKLGGQTPTPAPAPVSTATPAPVEDAKEFITDQLADQLQKDPMAPEIMVEAVKKAGITADDLAPYVVGAESNGNPNAVSPKGAKGRWQIMDATGEEIAKHFGETYDPSNEAQNDKYGRYYLQQQLDRRAKEGREDPRFGLADYNAGMGSVDQAIQAAQANGIENPTFDDIKNLLPKPKETVPYTEKIMGGFNAASPGSSPTPLPQVTSGQGPNIQHGASTSWDTPVSQESTDAAVDELTGINTEDNLKVADQLASEGNVPGIFEQAKSGLEMQKAAAIMKADASARGFQATTEIYNQEIQKATERAIQTQAKQNEYQKSLDEQVAKQLKAVDEFGAMSIDQNRLYSNSSTAQKLMAGIGVILSGLSGQKSRALEVIQGAIDRDLELQKAEMSLAKDKVDKRTNLIGQMQSRLGNYNEAVRAAEVTMWNNAKNMIQAKVDNSSSEIAKADGMSALGQIQERVDTLKNGMMKDAESRLAMSQNVDSDDKVSQAIVGRLNPQQQKRMVLIDGKFAGLAKNDSEATKIAEAHAEFKNSLNLITELKDLYKDVGVEYLPSTARAEADQIRSQLLKSMVKGSGLGAYDAGLERLYSTILPRDILGANVYDPGGLFTKGNRAFQAMTDKKGKDSTEALLDKLEADFKQKYYTGLQNRLPYKSKYAQSLIMDGAMRSELPDAEKITDKQ